MSSIPSVPSAPAAPASSAPASPAPAQAEGSAPQGAEVPAEATAAEKAAAKTEAQKENLRRKYELKVNGKSRSVDLDLSDDKAVQDYLQKALAADEKFQEAATLRKDVQQLVRTLKENPLAILTHPNVGVDVKKLAEMVINQELEDMQKSPEQKRLEQLEKELAQERSEKQRIEEERRQAEVARRQEEEFRRIDDDISDALANTDLPKTPYVVKRISDAMLSAFDLGYRDVSVKDIMPIVERQLKEELGQWFDSSSEDALEKLMGKNLDRIRKKRVAAQKALPKSTPNQVKPTGEAAKPKEEAPAKKQRFEDLFGKF